MVSYFKAMLLSDGRQVLGILSKRKRMGSLL